MSKRRARQLLDTKEEEKLSPSRTAVPAAAKKHHAVSHKPQKDLYSKPFVDLHDLGALQHIVGNQVVDHILRKAKKAGKVSSAIQMANNEKPAVTHLGGTPYYGRRMANAKMDPFQDQQNLFSPFIFRQYVTDMALWKPLMRLVNHYWLNQGNESGLILQPEEESVVWRLLNARLKPGEMQTVKYLYDSARPENKPDMLLDSFWVEFRREYGICHQFAREAYRASSFRLQHEFFAAWFGLVEPPFRYFAKSASG